MLTRAELKAAFVEAGVGRIAQQLAELSEPCVLVSTHAHPHEDLPIGESRIGGAPDLPATMEWPMWRDKPLAFLAQFNLADLARFACCRDLPSSGRLWFFYDSEQSTWGFDPQDRGSWRVLHAETNPADLQPRAADDLPRHESYQPCRVTFHEFLSIPGPEHLALASLNITLDEMEEIAEVDKDLHEMVESCSQDGGYESHHQLLGHPKEIQGEMQLDCQLAFHGYRRSGAFQGPSSNLEPGAKDWRLLFQLDTDDDIKSGKPGMMWGDCGRLYFWIRHDDLKQRRFENTWMILCG